MRPSWSTAALLVFVTISFGGCAQQPQQFAAAPHHGKEYFSSNIYGPASRRVVADGQPIPRGGGQYLVGKPYTVAGQKYYPTEHQNIQIGTASWYGDAFHGRLTANGEIYDRDGFTAAHRTMPLPSYARVTNLRNNYSMIVRVNDRGPYASNRIMDVSRRVAEALDYKRYGTTKLKVEYVGRASLAGSDDAKLYATLRAGPPAPWQSQPTMVAAAEPPARVASLAPYAPPPRREWREPNEPRVVAEQSRREADQPPTPRHMAAPRSQVVVAEPPRRASPPRADHEDRRMARAEPIRDGAERGRRKPALRDGTKDAETARQFALLEMRPAHRGAKLPEDTTGSIRKAKTAMVLPPSRPSGRAMREVSRTELHRHRVEIARARDA